MRKTAITFGLLSGLIIIAYTTITFLVFGDFSKITTKDLAMVETFGYLRYIILFLTLLFALRHFKKQYPEQTTFKRLFMAGLYTALVVAVLVGLMELVYMMMNPGFMDKYVSLSVQRLEEGGASAAEIAKQKQMMENMKWMANPAAMGIFYFIETAILGTIMSLILALLMKSKRKQAAFA